MSPDLTTYLQEPTLKYRLNPRWLAKMAWRDSRTHRKRLLLFVSSITIGIAALVGMSTLNATMQHSIDTQANALLGADLVVSSNQPFPQETETLLAELGGNQSPQVRFSSMVYFPKSEGMRLVQVRTLEGGFPYYGEFETEPAAAARDFTQGRNALVDETLMLQFDAAVGDSIRVGALMFQIAGRLQKIPGETPMASNLEPRLYIPAAYLQQTSLVRQGSRVSYRTFFKFEESRDVEALMERVQPHFEEHHLSYETVASRKRNIGRPLRNLYRFLNLGSFIALLLGSVGVASSIHAYIKQKLNTVAVLRSLGANAKQTLGIYLIQAITMGLIGSAAGVLVGIGVVALLPTVLSDWLPLDIKFDGSAVSIPSMLKGLSVGLGMAATFALLPLLRIRKISPLLALRASFEEAPARQRDPLRWLLYLLIALGIGGFAITQTRIWTHGAGFAVALVAAFGLLALVARIIIFAARRFFPLSWNYIWRQGLANLYRPNNQTTMLVLALGLGTFLIATLYLVQTALLNDISSVSNQDQPNMVLIDIQSDQVESVAALVAGFDAALLQQVPVVPMQLESIKGRSVQKIRNDPNSGVSRWAVNRDYRSTYRDHFTDTETLVEGQCRAHASGDTVFISLDQSLAHNLKVELGDEITFDVQGLPITTVVGSLRSVNWRRVRPNFMVLFPAGVLEEAPQFHVFVLRCDSKAESAALQRALAAQFPNVSTIDLQLILTTINTILDKASLVIRFMALFSVATGLLVLLGVITSSRYQHMLESVLLRTLGATRRQVVKIMLLEYFFLGSLAAFNGLLLALGSTWALTYFVFDISFAPALSPLVVVLVLVVGLTVVVGFLCSRGLHDRPPLEVLRTAG
jgi:putative ABC transport system permease protein